MTTPITVSDSYGRKTVFNGELLIEDTTDDSEGRKPQWLDIDVWRTEAGAFVVQRAINYRVVHIREACPKLEGYDTRPLEADDTVLCKVCNPEGQVGGTTSLRWAQASRVTVDVYREPQELIESLKVKGEYTRLSRSLLADLSDQDERIEALWNTVVVD